MDLLFFFKGLRHPSCLSKSFFKGNFDWSSTTVILKKDCISSIAYFCWSCDKSLRAFLVSTPVTMSLSEALQLRYWRRDCISSIAYFCWSCDKSLRAFLVSTPVTMSLSDYCSSISLHSTDAKSTILLIYSWPHHEPSKKSQKNVTQAVIQYMNYWALFLE